MHRSVKFRRVFNRLIRTLVKPNGASTKRDQQSFTVAALAVD